MNSERIALFIASFTACRDDNVTEYITLLTRLKALFATNSGGNSVPLFTTSIAPDTPFYAIGDVHGCVGLLRETLQKIDANRRARGHEDAPLILVGDLIDRGVDSAEVLKLVKEIQDAQPDQVVCLMGNHEKMMLDFLDDPAERGARWLRFGGVQTLACYQIHGMNENSGLDEMLEACDALEQALPEGMVSWLRKLPLFWQSGNVCCVHAAMSPEHAVDHQDDRTLLWGHHSFLKEPRTDGLWVVHGHTIFKHPQKEEGRISLDTGAFSSGKLTAALISKGSCEFL